MGPVQKCPIMTYFSSWTSKQFNVARKIHCQLPRQLRNLPKRCISALRGPKHIPQEKFKVIYYGAQIVESNPNTVDRQCNHNRRGKWLTGAEGGGKVPTGRPAPARKRMADAKWPGTTPLRIKPLKPLLALAISLCLSVVCALSRLLRLLLALSSS